MAVKTKSLSVGMIMGLVLLSGCGVAGKWSLAAVDPTAARRDVEYHELTLQKDGTFYGEAKEVGIETTSGVYTYKRGVLDLTAQDGERHIYDARLGFGGNTLHLSEASSNGVMKLKYDRLEKITGTRPATASTAAYRLPEDRYRGSSDVEVIHLYPVCRDGKWGYIDRSGTFVVDPQYDEGECFHDGFARVKRDGKWVFIRSTGEVASPHFEEAGDFSEGMALVCEREGLDRRCGYINRDGRVVVDFQFSDGGPFSNGLARVEKAGKWGYVDKSGRLVVTPQFDSAEDFREGLARVQRDGRYGYVDTQGRFAIAP
jgi:hypothetical protein